jgi:hypothetical protein
MSDDLLKVPKQEAGDFAIAGLRAVAGSLPAVGAGATEFVNLFLRPPLERRRDKWMEEVAERLHKLESRGIDLKALQNDERFIDTLMQATEVAKRNYQSEKWDALRNAIANSVGQTAPTESKRQMFLHFIDVLTVWHLKLLGFFAGPEEYLRGVGKSLPQGGTGAPIRHGIEMAFPDLQGQHEFYDQIWNELRQRGLVVSEPPVGIVTFKSPGLGKQTTTFGDEFLNFITAKKSDSTSTVAIK